MSQNDQLRFLGRVLNIEYLENRVTVSHIVSRCKALHCHIVIIVTANSAIIDDLELFDASLTNTDAAV